MPQSTFPLFSSFMPNVFVIRSLEITMTDVIVLKRSPMRQHVTSWLSRPEEFLVLQSIPN
ncbi:hypothetical protein T01_12912 [Trichinella spiralis]|uniref:Uncharacterized protein n=1 Tax=Trichinella spiralis TaxID=6334 RepID=A0A0V1AJ80_TRISP|nr:hypothetical protein T01_12912 [Trichinella spiralis]